MLRFYVFAALLCVTTAFVWDSGVPDVVTLNVCAGHEIALPWNFSLAQGERMEDIQWMYGAMGRDSEDIAVLFAGHFQVLPTFAGRVVRRGEAGLVISGATHRESGNYSVLVSVAAGGSLSRYLRTALVQISNFPQTDSGVLHANLNTNAVYDNLTNFWHLLLTCGHFTDLGNPPQEVIWVIPDGRVMESTYHNSSEFSLLIPNPPAGGNYSCRLRPSSLVSQCLPESSPLRQGSSIIVDKVEASFLLMQSAMTSLKQQENQMTALKTENSRLRNDLASLKADQVQLTSDLTALKNNISLAGAALQIGFHAKLIADTTLTSGQNLAPWTNITNLGKGFNPLNGTFVAPVSGLYFFIATTGSSSADNYANIQLMADGYSGTRLSETWLKRYSEYWSMGSVHAVLQLEKGQRVWLICHTCPSYFDSESTSFSGFLIGAD